MPRHKQCCIGDRSDKYCRCLSCSICEGCWCHYTIKFRGGQKNMKKRVKKRIREYRRDKWHGTKTSGYRRRERALDA